MSEKLETTFRTHSDSRAMRVLPEGWRKQYAEIGAGLIGASERYHTARRSLAGARELTPSAEKRLAGEYDGAIGKIEREQEAVLVGRAETERQRVLARSRPVGEAAVLAEIRRQGLDRLLREMEPLQVRAQYIAACRDGQDDELVHAVEDAPRSFRLVPQDVLAAGAEAKIERLAPLAAQLSSFASAIRALTTEARQELNAQPEVRMVAQAGR